jgi:hypothetical protein
MEDKKNEEIIEVEKVQEHEPITTSNKVESQNM